VINRSLLHVDDVSLVLSTERGEGTLLDHVFLNVGHGEMHGLVGESGCGKSTLVKLVLGLTPLEARIKTGRVMFNEMNLLSLSDLQMNDQVRGKLIGFIPQDPFQSFNPLFSVGDQIIQALKRSPSAKSRTRDELRAHLFAMLERVHIADPVASLRKLPHQFSGGQLQRLMIACAFACGPRLVLADEPTSALDVTTQQQVLTLIEELNRTSGVAVLLVTHELGLVTQHCDRVTVMYAGQAAETMSTDVLLEDAKHPYTIKLLACHPDRGRGLDGIPGIVPAIVDMPSGCRFHPRCEHAFEQCRAGPIPRIDVGPKHTLWCRLYQPSNGQEAAFVAS